MRIDCHANNFDFMRFVGASLVIWGHAFSLLHQPAPAFWGRGVHSLGIVIFFSISGFLVTASWDRSSSVLGFLEKRALRIFPGLVVCIFVSAFVLGPLLSRLSLGSYFSHALFFTYLENFALRIRYFLPGVFEQNHHSAVNGSLWSLPVEVLCYLAIVFLGLFAVRSRVIAAVGIAFLFSVGVFLYFRTNPAHAVVYGIALKSAFSVIPFFFAGSLCYLFGTRILYRADVALLLGAVLLFLSEFGSPVILHVASFILVPYVVLTLGKSSSPALNNWGSRWHGDASYGMYLYGAPIQQLIIHIYGISAPLELVLLGGLLGAMLCGVLSWHFVEKHALKLKDKAGGGVFGARLLVRRMMQRAA